MKIVQINSFSNGSTGKIMMSIHNELRKQGIDSYVVWGRGRNAENDYEIYMNDKFGVYFHVLYSRITGKTGFASKRATKKLIKKLKKINPDIVHLHNIHGYYINIEILFDYLKKNNIKVVWTLHDCWAFTGQCSHFDYVKCQKWKQQCIKCPQLGEYPKSLIDNSKYNFKKKKEIFTSLENMNIVTPSIWLSNLVKQSFLNKYKVEVINNGIDLNIFKPTKSDFRKKFNLESKKIILGVASVWNKRKGLDDFIELSKIIDEDTKIILVGLSKKQLKKIPSNIFGITRTENQEELVKIYSSADIFFNPTREDNYPTVNLESLACKTPVYTYNVGGAFECINERNGGVIDFNDLKNNYKKYILGKYNFDVSTFDNLKMSVEYIKIYKLV